MLLGSFLILSATASAQINVPADQPTIQAAVTAATAGTTITVDPGTYTENVTINKQVFLLGAQSGVDARGRVVGAPSPVTESIVTAGSGTLFTLTGGSAGTIIDGFSLVGADRGIESSSGPINDLEIRNNHVEGQSAACVFLNDSGIDITVHQNVFIGAGSPSSGTVFHLDTDNFDGFHFTCNIVTRTGPPASTGFFVDGNHNVGESVARPPLFDQNEFTNHAAGMNAGTRAIEYATFSSNSYSNNSFDGLQGGIQHSSIHGNTFDSNGRYGLALTSFGNMGADRGGQFDTITGNTFSNNVTAGLFFSSSQAPGTISTNEAHANVFAGNIVAASYVGTETINCQYNFWGDLSGPSGDGPGTGDPVSGMTGGGAIVFAPWLNCGPIHPTHEVGDGPLDVLLADLVGSSALDFATADSGSDSVTVRENDGLGDFSAPATTIALTPGDAPAALAAGDLVAGGGVDLAVACADAKTVRVIENTGAGFNVFSSHAVPAGTSRPVHLTVCDIDGVFPDDIVIAMEGDLIPGDLGGLAIIQNLGAATLLPAPPGGFKRVLRVVCCDLDGDGDDDVAATRTGAFGGSLGSDQVLLYENVLGVLSYVGALTTSQEASSLCCDDLDGDGDADLAVTVHPLLGSGGVETFVNDGSLVLAPGNFSSTGVTTTGLLPDDVACADLLQDSIPGFIARHDVLTINLGAGSLSSLIAFDGVSYENQELCIGGTNPVALAVGDLDGDYTPDVVVANFGSDDVSVLLTTELALAQTFGAGCPGYLGQTPQISAVGLPTYGNPAFGVMLSNARPFAPSLMLLSLNLDPQPIGGGCTLFLGAPLATVTLFTNGAGTATVTLPIPGDVAPYPGLSAYFQFAVFDPAGAYAGSLAFSNALRIKLGN